MAVKRHVSRRPLEFEPFDVFMDLTSAGCAGTGLIFVVIVAVGGRTGRIAQNTKAYGNDSIVREQRKRDSKVKDEEAVQLQASVDAMMEEVERKLFG